MGRRRVRHAFAFTALLASASSVEARPAGEVRIAYMAPTSSALRPLRDELVRHRVLERIRDIVAGVKLPASLLLKTSECRGESNAWYAPENRSVTICYELIRDIEHDAPKTVSKAGITRREAIVGPVMQVALHETGHAMFDLLKIPVLGHEEDAADEVAALIILKLAPGQAKETIDGAAYSMASYAKQDHPGKADFADEHPLFAQRFISLICFAYGSDPHTFAYLKNRGYLPKERAEECPEEYASGQFAFATLFGPHLRANAHALSRVRNAFKPHYQSFR